MVNATVDIATQARTMEHFRRLGFAQVVRALGLPKDYPTEITNFTRYAGLLLVRPDQIVAWRGGGDDRQAGTVFGGCPASASRWKPMSNCRTW